MSKRSLCAHMERRKKSVKLAWDLLTVSHDGSVLGGPLVARAVRDKRGTDAPPRRTGDTRDWCAGAAPSAPSRVADCDSEFLRR
jgi:hypothetical protein